VSAPALFLIGHGSRSAAGVEQFWAFSRALGAAAPDLPLGAGLIEFAEPGLDEGIDKLVAGGAAAVVAVPLVLLGAGHLKDDGPGALARARRRHPGVAFSYARDLGVHPAVLAAVEDRAREAIGDLPGDGRGAVLLVGRGSTDPDANADLAKAARLLADRRRLFADGDLDEVEPAFVSLARPSVHEGLDRLERLGARRVAVVPYFLFTGLLPERLREESLAWAAGHSRVEVSVGHELGADERIVSLVLERYHEALTGDVRMNCDGCLYRASLPGYETRLGAPNRALGERA